MTMTEAVLVTTHTIRPATAEDLDVLITMAEHFLADTVYHQRTAVTLDSLRTSTMLLIDRGVVLMAFDAEQRPIGILAGLAYDHYLANTRMASESVWWVEPCARGSGVAQDLLSAFEAWAVDHGAMTVEIGSWHPRLDRFYARLGYDPAERIFRKDVSHAQSSH